MRTLLAIAFLLVLSAHALAQSAGGGPPPDVRMRIGPLFINPTLSLSNAGRDTNVFNESTNAKSDFTVTVTPATDLWLRFGPSWLQSNIKEEMVWFQQFSSERAANNSYNLKWLVPLNRLTLTPTWTYLNTRERPGFEIDARAQRTSMNYGGIADFRFLSKTSVVVGANRTTTNFDKAAVFLGTNLHDELNRTSTTASLSLQQQITPLTSLSFSAAQTQDRFEFDSLRNSDSLGYAGSIKFDPAALIKGGASFGYRDFRPASPDLAGYKGFTMSGDMSYVLLGMTKFGASFNRDIQYSFDVNQPYYLQTGGGLSVSQQLFGPFDVVARGALTRLEYRDRAGAVVAVSDRVDHTTTYGGGLGFHISRDMRFGFNVDQSQRQSGVVSRQYKGLQYGFAVTYGSGS
jgi:hypothetical protein